MFWRTKFNTTTCPRLSYLGQNRAVTPRIGPWIVMSKV